MQVLEQRAAIEEMNATAIFVVHDEPELVRRMMLADLEVPFTVLVDPDRSAYRLWGMGRASFARIYLDVRVWLPYARLLLGGERFRGMGADTLQLGGDFVVGPDGVLVYARPQHRDDRPPVSLLLGELWRAGHGTSN